MIVPRYWAEARAQHRERRRQITVSRFGWSDASQEEAQANAEQRVREALGRLVAGEKLPRRERRVPYNGAEGIPIREEIVSRDGDSIVTRNSYGARCLNTPNVLFADIDYRSEPPLAISVAAFSSLLVAATVIAWSIGSKRLGIAIALAVALLGYPMIRAAFRLAQGMRGGAARIARRRVARFVRRNSDWNLRVYGTPAGLRLLATHRTFDPTEDSIAEFFSAVGADPVYRRMCANQRCFRARVSAKPWRAGISTHIKPRPGTWPVSADRVEARTSWVEAYEAVARRFAACSFIEALGSGKTHFDVRGVVQLHDELSGANRQLPLA